MKLNEFLENKSAASYVQYGYGQVEPNHLSAQRTAQIYAQLPANADIDKLEQGQFVKYDYAADNGGEVNFTGKGEWMLVYNEIKLYREGQRDCEFAMIKENYSAKFYSPYDYEKPEEEKNSRDYTGIALDNDPYELDATDDPYKILGKYEARKMPAGTSMVPRVFKTNVGDIMTTNTINAETLKVGDKLTPGAEGILEVTAAETGMLWQVVKVYTMPDGQPGVKIMRIA
jgi:hypothetical protein